MTYAEPANMTGIIDMFTYANSVSDNIFGVGILISLYLIVFGYLNMKNTPAPDCAAVAGYFTAVVAIFVFLMGLVNSWHLFIAIIVCTLSVIWAYTSKSS